MPSPMFRYSRTACKNRERQSVSPLWRLFGCFMLFGGWLVSYPLIVLAGQVNVVYLNAPETSVDISLGADDPAVSVVDGVRVPWYCGSNSLRDVNTRLSLWIQNRNTAALDKAVNAIWREQKTPPDAFFGNVFPDNMDVFLRFDAVKLAPHPGSSILRQLSFCYTLGELKKAKALLIHWAGQADERWLQWSRWKKEGLIHLSQYDMTVLKGPVF